MRTLILFIHADPVVRSMYERALAGIPDHDLVIVNCGSFSSAYREAGERFRGPGGRVLPSLLARYAPRPMNGYDEIVMITFSAGYALAREVLKSEEDRKALSALVMLDALHAGFDADHSAADTQLAPFVAYAHAAKAGGCLFWLGHSDVHTPQSGPGAFASTTQAAAELVRLAGGTGGKFHVRAFDVRKVEKEEHAQALIGWGPDFAAEALVPWLGSGWRGEAPTEPAPPPVPSLGGHDMPRATLGERALALALAELAANVREVPGPGTSPRIAAYERGAERAGHPVGLISDELAWCAAAASWCAYEAREPGDAMPHGWRLAVRELWEDAVAAGTARPPSYRPRAGDLGIYRRLVDGRWRDPTRGEEGHVGRVETDPDASGRYPSLDGNQGLAWGRRSRSVADPDLVGWITYPRAPGAPTGPLDAMAGQDDGPIAVPSPELQALLDAPERLRADVAAGRVGVEAMPEEPGVG